MRRCFALLLGALLISAGQDRVTESKEVLRIVAVNKTPESGTIITAIQLPHDGDVISANPVWVQVRLDGYALGSNPEFDRANEVATSSMGQTLHVVVDNEPYFAINGPSIQPFNEEGFYYTQSYKFELPFRLSEGTHTIRVFPARSFGESLKGENVYQASYFRLGGKANHFDPSILSRPYITYNEPGDQMRLREDRPVLLDFYVSNCVLSPDGFKVRLTIDGKMQRTLVAWQPYYIYGLKKGKHTIRLELLDNKNKVVPGVFNDVQRTVTIGS